MNVTKPSDGHTIDDFPAKVRLLHSDVGEAFPLLSATKNRNKRILVVDDDPDVAFSIKIGLEYDDSFYISTLLQ